MANKVQVSYLGQSGLVFQFAGTAMCTDPYLSHSVEEKYGSDFARLTPIPSDLSTLAEVRYLFISHNHEDHCDPESLAIVLERTPSVEIFAPYSCHSILLSSGASPSQIHAPPLEWCSLGDEFRCIATPAAHPDLTKDADGNFESVGYVFEISGRRVYFAGDTSVHSEIISVLDTLAPLDTAFLPVNEKNYFRDTAGIIGNMSVREAFGLCDQLGIKQLIPIHWDMFPLNQTYREEIELLKKHIQPNVEVLLQPEFI